VNNQWISCNNLLIRSNLWFPADLQLLWVGWRGPYLQDRKWLLRLQEGILLCFISRNLTVLWNDSLECLRKLKQSLLRSELALKKSKSVRLYKNYQVEQCGQQHALAWKEKLEKQIYILQLAGAEHSRHQKSFISSAGHTVDSLLKLEKENHGLHSELSCALEHSQTELGAPHLKLNQLSRDLHKSCDKHIVSRNAVILLLHTANKQLSKHMKKPFKKKPHILSSTRVSIQKRHVILFICWFELVAQKTILEVSFQLYWKQLELKH